MALSVAGLDWLHLDAILLVGAHAVVVVLRLVDPADRGMVGELATFIAGTTAIAAAALVAFAGIGLRPARAACPVSAWWRWLSRSPGWSRCPHWASQATPALRALLRARGGAARRDPA